jgi:ubiquinone/menaquinone biosynthesis C-methylase UbiE
MLNVAKERLSNMEIDNVSLISGDVNHLPLPDNHFDGVYAILVLNLLPDIESIFSEVARVVKKDGIFVFNLPNLSSIYFAGGAYVNMRGKTVTKNEAGYRYSQWYTYSQVSEMLRKSGFSLDVVVGQPPLLRFSNWQQCGTRSAVGYFFSKSLYYKARRL